MSARRSHLRLGAALLAVALVAFTGTASAAKVTRAPSKVAIEALQSNSAFAFALGSVTSPDDKCVAGRKVVVTIIPSKGSPFVFDVARTSDDGGWLAARSSIDLEPVGSVKRIKAEVLPRKVKLGKKTLLCGGKTVTAGVA